MSRIQLCWLRMLALLMLKDACDDQAITALRTEFPEATGIQSAGGVARLEWVSALKSVFDSQRPFVWSGSRQPYRLLLLALVALGLNSLFPGLTLADGPATVVISTSLRLQIPAIGLDSPVEPVSSRIIEIKGQTYRQWETSDSLVGWHDRSAAPGEVGNTVLAGHSDIYSRVFQNLHQVAPGDLVLVEVGTKTLRYVVSDVVELREVGVSMAQRVRNGHWITTTDDERLTLITCSRPGATHRLVVVARPAAAPTDQRMDPVDLPLWPQVVAGPQDALPAAGTTLRWRPVPL